MRYSKTGKYCIFDSQDYTYFQEASKLHVFKKFLKNNNAMCTDDADAVYAEAKHISNSPGPEFIDLYEGIYENFYESFIPPEQYYNSVNKWYFCYCRSPGIQTVRKLYNNNIPSDTSVVEQSVEEDIPSDTSVVEQSVEEDIPSDTSVVEQSAKENITCVKPNDDKGGCTMANVNESFKTVLSMKMLKGIMKGGDADLGKLFLMQQMTNGQPLQVSDVIKSKLINEFSLDKDGDMPLEKVLLLQMLDGGSIDMSQLIMFKMMGSLLDEDSDKKKE